ncbi:MAG: efflux RND transporter periplasmic adaptor subunit [Terriglobales bacterium]|jgi:HlyD family secretion protein
MANGNNGTAARNARRNWAILAGIVFIVFATSTILLVRPRKIRVQIIRPQRQDILSTITTNGKVEPRQNFEAHSPASTTVKRIFVQEGAYAKPGQLLLQLDDASARAELAQATAQLKAAQASNAALQAGGSQEELLNRQASLTKAKGEYDTAGRNLQALTRLQQEGAASQQEVTAAHDRLSRAEADLEFLQQKGTRRFSPFDQEKVQADLANAEAAVKAAQDLIARSNVQAPFAGTVYSLPVRQGAFVNTGDLLVEVADLTQMQVRAFIDEPDIGRLRMDQTVRISWDGMPGRLWSGKVSALPTNIVNRGSRMIGEVLCAVDNQDKKLLPNVNVTAIVVTADTTNALTLPREALHQEDNRSIVYVVEDGRLVGRPVQTGVANLTHIEITKGLSENDTVALASLSPSPLSDGAAIKVVDNP